MLVSSVHFRDSNTIDVKNPLYPTTSTVQLTDTKLIVDTTTVAYEMTTARV
jgi:hypothetical protein